MPVCLEESKELSILAGFSLCQDLNSTITFLKLDPLGRKNMKQVRLAQTEEVVGMAFEDRNEHLLVLAVNEYESLNREFPLPRSYLKLANVRALKLEVVSK